MKPYKYLFHIKDLNSFWKNDHLSLIRVNVVSENPEHFFKVSVHE